MLRWPMLHPGPAEGAGRCPAERSGIRSFGRDPPSENGGKWEGSPEPPPARFRESVFPESSGKSSESFSRNDPLGDRGDSGIGFPQNWIETGNLLPKASSRVAGACPGVSSDARP